MPPPVLTSGPIQSEDIGPRRFRLLRELISDLGELIELAETYQGVSVSPHGWTEITVPKGFETDFSSIPLWAQAILMGPKDNYRVAGTFHDWCYFVGMPRRPADRIWRRIAMVGSERVGFLRGWAGWLALRGFAWRAYNNHREANS